MTWAAAAAGLLLAGGLVPSAGAEGLEPLTAALLGTKSLVDVRLRYEDVQQVPLTVSAVALTLRTRLGVETGSAWETSLLVEGSFLASRHE